MDYLLFTFPACPKCAALKTRLSETGIPFNEYSVTRPEGKAKIREFINVIKLDDKGAVVLPIIIAHSQGVVRAVLSSPDEFESLCRNPPDDGS